VTSRVAEAKLLQEAEKKMKLDIKTMASEKI
jgi:hypothetical protein